ncbi:response regulator [Leeuwenhoekiella marinoflava]|uniref:histidine kinase n=2 Tax=Leeuwenhoekiella marinoflava TaxID=988 RepID=A0A4Q0PK99_9FLAO|nr:response regulator [Leeuwenhoekiella marinoflava]RXG28364.1 signal transduction histidine kinase [Leeuwenhoekiella marinoflava]SHF54996.1 Signal transduction histidine kinase [Leeuwenhoekiella marinoflava DSM 3653]
MSSFIERLLNHRASKIKPVPVRENPITDFFEYLYDLGTSGARLTLIKSKIKKYEFAEDTYIRELQIAQFYLELENYLIHHDSRYINTEVNLRSEIKMSFPDVVKSEAFLPLYHSGKNQEIVISRLFLLIILKKFKDEDLELSNTISWIKTIESQCKEPVSSDLVKQINAFRKTKDDSLKINQEFGEIFGQDFVDSVFSATKEEFFNYYRLIPTVTSISDIIPQLFTSLLHESHTTLFFDKPKEPSVDKEQGKIIKETINIDTSKIDILENILDAYLLFDSDGIIKDCNSRASVMFDLKGKELINKSIFTLLPSAVSRDIRYDISNLYKGLESEIIGSCIELDLSTEPNYTLPCELSFSNNFSKPADTFTLLIKDISHRKDSLKAKINAERTAEAKSTFLSNMSHEIRTPLNVILGLSEILSNGNLEDKKAVKKNLDGISFSAKNLLSIVNDILDFSKIEAGKLTFQSLDFNLREVIYNLATGFEIKAREKGVQFISEIDEQIPDIVIGDQYRLNQIITNLVGNAIKFTKRGSISLNLKLIAKNTENVKIKFSVNDTGIGIAEDKLESIFNSFYQVDEPELAKINGSGLGLTITKELINLQKGKLEATSKLGEGSTFEFTLDFKISQLKKMKDIEQDFKDQNLTIKGLRVLVAEDNKMNQFYIRQLLQGLDVQADIAENGEEAVAIYQNAKTDYDLILMDMHMPVMNGLEAISQIRQSNKDSLKKIPIVACSADVFPEARKNAIKAGIDFYLTKPLKEEALKEVLYWLVADEGMKTKPVIGNTKTEETTDESVAVDIKNLFEIFDGDKEFIISLLEVFIQETPEDLNSLRNCVTREYYPRASTLAHKMKSSFMNLGLTKPGQYLQQIEANINTPDKVEEAKKSLKSFENLYNKVLLDVNLQLINLKNN